MEGVAGAVRIELLDVGGQHSPAVLQLYSVMFRDFGKGIKIGMNTLN